MVRSDTPLPSPWRSPTKGRSPRVTPRRSGCGHHRRRIKRENEAGTRKERKRREKRARMKKKRKGLDGDGGGGFFKDLDLFSGCPGLSLWVGGRDVLLDPGRDCRRERGRRDNDTLDPSNQLERLGTGRTGHRLCYDFTENPSHSSSITFTDSFVRSVNFLQCINVLLLLLLLYETLKRP